MPNLSLRKLWRKRSVTISEKDPSYKVIYLGNVLTGWAKGDGCVDKPLSTLWRNYCQSSRSDIIMKITICGSGLQAVTREHGLTEYWAHRVTYCGAHPAYPKVFCWVYRHEGRRLKQELRCHAVLCHRSDKAQVMANQLKERLALALHEFRREKVVRQNARLSLVHAIYDNAALPTRKVLLSTGSANYRPPLERSKSAPKLGSIEETLEEDEEDDSPLDEEEDELEVRERNVKCSPVGSIALSETMSDIVHYNSSDQAAVVAAACSFSRSASQKSLKSKRGNDTDEETKLPTRASNINSNARCSFNSSISYSSDNSNDSNTLINSNSNNNSNNKDSLYVYSHKLAPSIQAPSIQAPSIQAPSIQAPSIQAPVLKRRFIRSISVDTTLDHDDDIDDFDDDDEVPIINDKDILRLTNSIARNSPLRNNLHELTFVKSEPVSCESFTATDSTEEELSSSVTSTDTTDTVLDRPLNTEDAINNMTLINSLSHSLTRQLSLPPDAQPPEESLTSDQPESLGSHCDSCSSSCGGCSDAGVEGNHLEDIIAAGGTAAKDRLLGMVVGGGTLANLGNLSSLSTDAEEPDNISEESGYAEEKDFLQNAELTKTLNAQ